TRPGSRDRDRTAPGAGRAASATRRPTVGRPDEHPTDAKDPGSTRVEPGSHEPAGERRSGDRIDRDSPAVPASPLEGHHPVDQREERVITTAPHVPARVDLRPTLTDDDVARAHDLAAEALDAQVLRPRVPAVARRAASLLVRHIASLPEPDLADPDLGVLLPMSLLATIVLPPLPLEDDDLLALAVLDDLAGHDRALDRRRADTDLTIGTGQQHLRERHLVTDLGSERGDADRLPRLDAELLVACANDCVHDLRRASPATRRPGPQLPANRPLKSRICARMSRCSVPIAVEGVIPARTSRSRPCLLARRGVGTRPAASAGRRVCRVRAGGSFRGV